VSGFAEPHLSPARHLRPINWFHENSKVCGRVPLTGLLRSRIAAASENLVHDVKPKRVEVNLAEASPFCRKPSAFVKLAWPAVKDSANPVLLEERQEGRLTQKPVLSQVSKVPRSPTQVFAELGFDQQLPASH
jgi:hypothetical protein